jgi:ABC-type nitrate/sulfonate/bicarbonate transport system substrate-binding protein
MCRYGWGMLALAAVCMANASSQDADRPLRVYGNTTTIELAPVLMAAERFYPGPVTVTNGGIPNLFRAGEADVATNAETQALRQSVDHPNLRIIFTVSEGFYRVLARRSAGITKLEDLRGKKVGTVPLTSSGYYLAKMLGTAGLTEQDVTLVRTFPLHLIPGMMQKGEIDAVTIWEPEIQKAADLLGADAIEFQDRSVYRELFNLNTTAEKLADPAMRRQIVAFVRALIRASAQVRKYPEQVWPLVAKSTGYPEHLISHVWHHEGYPGTMVSDLLDVLVEEEVWIARERNRTPRTREQLATLIDDSVLREALAQEQAEAEAEAVEQRVQRLAAGVEAVEAVRAVKRLQHAYAHYLEAGMWDEAAALFTKDAVAATAMGKHAWRDSIRAHLIDEHGGSKGRIGDGQLNTILFLSPVVTLNPDGRTAKGRWHMLALRGEYGASATWAGGIYENEYALEDGVWKISKEMYYPQYAGPYDTGWRSVSGPYGSQFGLVPYHYTPDRAGTVIPDAAASASARPAASKKMSEGELAARLAELEQRAQRMNDASAVQNLQNAYGFYVDRKMWDDVADLFAPDGTLELDQQGVFVGKASIRRALEQFGPPGLREGEVNDHLQLQPVVTVAPDGRSARARGTELRMTGMNNVGAQWGVGIYENTYVKQDGVWKIASMRIVTRMSTDYAKGWAVDARPVRGPIPEFPADRPPTQVWQSYPTFYVPPFHFTNPATTRERITTRASRPRSQAELLARLANAEKLLATAEAYDGAENVSNAYGYYIDEFQWHDTADLFAENGWKELSYIGTYVGRERVRKSLTMRYGNGGRRGPMMAIHQKTQPFVSVAADGRSARMRTRLFQINSAPAADGSYIAGIYENEIVKENGVWKIQGMDLDYVWTTGYKNGWANVKSGDATRFAPQAPVPYPPDRPLRGAIFAPFPKVHETGFHFRNPVSGREPPLLLN